MGNNIKDAITRAITLSGPLSAHSLATDMDVSRQYVHRVLSELVKSGAVIKTGQPPSVC